MSKKRRMAFDEHVVAVNMAGRAEAADFPLQVLALLVAHDTAAEPASRYEAWERDRILATANLARAALAVLGPNPPHRFTRPDLDLVEVEESGTAEERLTVKQAQIHAMIGPDFMFVNGFACRRPADFYFDARTGPAKFPKKLITGRVAALANWAGRNGMDPHNLPALVAFHNCGVF